MTVFGSARFPEHHPYYQLARQVGRELADAGFTVMTGGGPGIMEAANRGAQEAGGFSIGCNIELPQEQERNRYLDQWVDFNHFFDRSPSHATTSKPLPHRAGPFRIMCMDSYPWIVRRAAGNSRKPCLAFTVERLVSFAPFQINRLRGRSSGSGARVILGNTGQHNRSTIRKFGHQRQGSTHRLYRFPECGQQQITALLKPRDAVLGDPQLFSYAEPA